MTTSAESPRTKSARPPLPRAPHPEERTVRCAEPFTIAAPEPAPLSGVPSHGPQRPRSKLLLIPFRNGETLGRHPEVRPYIRAGWRVTSAAPRVTEGGTKLLVVLG